MWFLTRSKLHDACDGSFCLKHRFDGASFRKAAARIAPTGYTDFISLEAEIGLKDMAALIKYDFVAIRPYSQWARDLPAEAFPSGSHYLPLATASSSIDLYCMRMLAREGELKL